MCYYDTSQIESSLKKINAIDVLADRLLDVHKLPITIGIELEFYLSNDIDIMHFSHTISNTIKHNIQRERGHNQFEIALLPACSNPYSSQSFLDYAKMIIDTKNTIIDIADQLNSKAYITSKPFINDYGNGMHVHIGFGEVTNEILTHIAQSICYFMKETALMVLPTDEDYLRLDKKFLAPTHISFGNNNRSVALRMPDTIPKRLEYRVSGMNSSPYLVIFTILNSILKGLNQPSVVNANLMPKIYGNAYDAQYKLVPLPQSLKESYSLFNEEFYTQSELW